MDRNPTGRSDCVSRRTLLKTAAVGTAGLATAGAFADQAAARESDCEGCLRVCWVDVKPSSCPNSVNPDGAGVLPVTAGWPNFHLSTVELVPVKASYDAAFGRCQDWEAPRYDTGPGTATELCELVADADRSASPTGSTVEDVDGDGDLDTKFRFDVSDLDLEADDTYLVLVGESTDSDCTYVGIDSVRVVGGNGGGQDGSEGRGHDN